jgi:hypothetical protein
MDEVRFFFAACAKRDARSVTVTWSPKLGL